MPPAVTVIDRSPVLAQGLLAALERAGIAATQHHPSADALDPFEGRAVLRTTGLRDLDLVEQLSRGVDAEVTVVLPPDIPPSVTAAYVRAGATDVLPDTVDLDLFIATVNAPQRTTSVLPRSSLEFMSAVAVDREHVVGPRLTVEETGWIRSLALGAKVHEIAEDAGYSERSMFRRLDRIYAALGAENRTQALLAAERLGILSIDG